ncbi:MAG: GNAT family acetyltransferase [Chloroflexi bacterium]|nr:GNAT family acetyltransferase [Chloroflexota bacterium]
MLMRPFQMSDYPAVLALWQQSGPGITLRPSDEPAEVARKLERDPDLFLVAEEDTIVIGVIMGAWDGRRGWIHHLAVQPSWRNRGVGSALLSEVEKRLKAKGCLKVNLMVLKDNIDAQRLYARLGYQAMASTLLMGKEL